MKPRIDTSSFGSITIAGSRFERDVVITLGGEVKKRKKKLSKAIYGTSHVISLDEARHFYEEDAEEIVIGAGQFGRVKLSEEAEGFLQEKGCQITLLPTPEAIQAWNEAAGATIGLFHVTC
jgi:hypothetical protein